MANKKASADTVRTGIEEITTQGDLLYRGETDLKHLSKGSSGQTLKMGSGNEPEWATVADELPAAGTSGNVLTSTGSAWASTAVASSFGDSFRATISANPTLPNNSIVKVTFDSEMFDTANKYDHATNYRYTPAAGKYLLTARIGMTAKNDQHNIILIKKNGTTHSQGGITTYDSNNSGDAHVMNLITIVDSNGTDYWEVWYTHQWGSARSLDGSGGANEFSGVRIG